MAIDELKEEIPNLQPIPDTRELLQKITRSGRGAARWAREHIISLALIPLGVAAINYSIINQPESSSFIDQSSSITKANVIIQPRPIEFERIQARAEAGPQEAPELIQSLSINNVKTYGNTEPLVEADLKKLYTSLNTKKEQLDDHTLYSTIFVSEDTYKNFDNDKYQGSFQEFLVNHFRVLNSALEQGSIKTDTPALKVELRRLVVLQNGVQPPDTFDLTKNISDSDGGLFFVDDYDPAKAAFFNKNNNIDNGLIHEIGHSLLHLPDGYALDMSIQPNQPTDILPEQWQSYSASHRNDTGNDLMSTNAPEINEHSMLQLARREDIHSPDTVVEASWTFPNEIPDQMIFDFGPFMKDLQLNLYQSYEIDPNKRVNEYNESDDYYRIKGMRQIDSLQTNSAGEIEINYDNLNINPTEFNMIPAESSTYLIVGKDKTGKQVFRWFDIRDLNLAAWKNHKDSVVMQLNMATQNDNPKTFDWKINYFKDRQEVKSRNFVKDATKLLQNLQQETNEIMRQNPELIPNSHLKKVINCVKDDLAQFEDLNENLGQQSTTLNKIAQDIISYYQTPPEPKKDVSPLEITVDPEVKNGDILTEYSKELLEYFPGVVKQIDIVPRNKFPDSTIDIIVELSSEGAKITVASERYVSPLPITPYQTRPFLAEQNIGGQWNKKDYARSLMALGIAPEVNPFNEGLALLKLTREELIHQAYAETLIHKKVSPWETNTSRKIEDDNWFTSDMLVGSEDYSKNRGSKAPAEDEITQARRDFTNSLLSYFTHTELAEIRKKLGF